MTEREADGEAKYLDVWNDGVPIVPYLRHYTSSQEAMAAWQALKDHDALFHFSPEKYMLANANVCCKWIATNGYAVIVVDKNCYYTINFLTDFFTEPARLRARRYHEPLTAVEYWHKNGQAFVASRAKTPSLRERRDWLYSQTIEVCNLRLTVAASLLDFFKPESVFETCAGRGTFAFAAYSRPSITRFEACEPDPLCVELIGDGLDTLRFYDSLQNPEHPPKKEARDFTVHMSTVQDFLTSTLSFQSFKPLHMFDMVCVCPPFFDVEIYSDSKSQSIQQFPDQESWYSKWLVPMIRGSWTRVNENGVLLLSINNAKDHTAQRFAPLRFSQTERLVAELRDTLPNSTYLGVISYRDGTRYEPNFVWRKKTTPSQTPSQPNVTMHVLPTCPIANVEPQNVSEARIVEIVAEKTQNSNLALLLMLEGQVKMLAELRDQNTALQSQIRAVRDRLEDHLRQDPK